MLVQAARLARREMRGGGRGFRVFLACLALGVGAVAAVGSLGAAVQRGIVANARDMLGGDVSARLALRPANDDERQFLGASGTVSEAIRMRGMARSIDGGKRSLIELQAVDAAYPLYGAVTLKPAQSLAQGLAAKDGTYGAAVEAAVASRLGIAVGDTFRIGSATLQLRGVIENQPDAAFVGLAFGPRVLLSRAGLDAARLLGPGAIVNYEYRLRLPAGTNAAEWIATAKARFPEAGWQLRSAAEGSPGLQRFLDRIAFFLHLAAISALLVGGIGIGNAVAGYVESRTGSIATLKCLGASNALIFSAYLLQLLVMAASGIAMGLAVGGAAPMVIAPLIKGVLPVTVQSGLYVEPLAIAALCGVLATLAFSLWPLAAIGAVRPAALFRERVEPVRRGLAPVAAFGSFVAALGLAVLVIATAPDRRIAVWYIAAALGAFAIFRGAGALVVIGARRLPRPLRPAWRVALANLHRPGAPTPRVVLSLGIGLSVMMAIALVQGNLGVEIRSRLAEHAPADFFLDIQPDQLAGFEAMVRSTPDATFAQVPMLRGRITQINGVAVEKAQVEEGSRWALSGDRGLTYASTVPDGSQVSSGSWWPADYHGPPLISFDAGLAEGMGLKIGDTLTVNLLGRDVTARIANLRRIDWTQLGINFAIVFAPGVLEDAPQTHLAAVYLPPAREEGLVRQVTEQFPNVSAIPVRESLATVAGVVATIGVAIRVVGLVTLGAGVLVLGAALAAGQRRRVYDAVILQVLGASRGTIARAFLMEHALLGGAVALVAVAVGTSAAYLLVTGPLHSDWVFLARPLFGTAAAAILITLGFGLAGTWRALGAKPAAYLRNE